MLVTMSRPDARGERTAAAAFVASSVLAGGNAVCIRFSNRELDPLWGAGLRFSLAALLLIAVVAAFRLELPRGWALLGAGLYGALGFGAAFALAYYSLVDLHAGLAQTLLALVPLATLLVAVAERQERFRRGALLGALVAFLGIAVMARAPLEDEVPLVAVVAAIGAAFCFAQAAIVVRWFPPVHPVTMNAVGMATGAVLLVGASLVAGDSIALPEQRETWTALGYLVLIGSVVVFVLYLLVLRYWTASRTSYEFVLIPVVTVALSAWLDDEPIRIGLVVGGLLVIAGVYVGALRPTGDAREPAERLAQQRD
jgi:drug/metabolite transporter (DMT)-like permease